MTHPGEEYSVGPFDGSGHAAPWLDRYRTGELAADERERIAGHLEGCPACRDELARLHTFAATVARGFAAERALHTAAGRAPDWARQQAAIVARTSAGARAARAPRRGWLPGYAPQAALALVAVIAVGVMLRGGIRGPEDMPAPDAAEETERAVAGNSDPKPAPSSGETETSATAARGTPAPVPFAAGRANGAHRQVVIPAAPPPPGADLRQRRAAQDTVARTEADVQDAAPRAAVAERAKEDALARDEAKASLESRAAAEPTAGQAAAEPVADPFDRFSLEARRALDARNAPAAALALAFWRDSLAPRADLAPARRRAGVALADSLSELVSEWP